VVSVSIKFLFLRGANKHIFVKDFLDLMRSMTSAQCQQTAEDWFNKSVALHDQGNYADAIQALDKAIRLSPNNPINAIAWNNKGLALYSQGEYDEAVKA
jgi:tetratricopeptide (TPR) repeat protein